MTRWEGTLAGHAGRPVYVRRAEPPHARAQVVLLHGYSEHAGRYGRVIDALTERGFAVVAPDHRGHGRTAVVRGDLEDRHAVLSDLTSVIAATRSTGPRFLVAHSLGAVLGLRMVELWPGLFDGAVLNGPALKIPDSIRRSVRLAARALAEVAPTLPIQPFFDPTRNMRDPVAQAALRDDPLVYKGRIRARTAREVMDLIGEVWADLSTVTLPLLVTHGASDRHVSSDVSAEVVRAVGSSDATLRVFPGLLHETWQEPEKDDVIRAWCDWIDARLG